MDCDVIDADGHVTESGSRRRSPTWARTRRVYASDFPHWDHSFPKSIAELKGRLDAQKRKVLADNARRLDRLA